MQLKKIIAVLFLISTLASCKKILDTEPSHVLDGSERFKSIEDHEFALIGAYRLFRQGSYYGAGSNAYVNLPDMISDNMNETGESLSNYTTLSTWRYAEDDANIDATWQAAYRVISQVNLVLRDLDDFTSENPPAVNRIKSQALAIRGMVHFDILRYWVEEYDRNSTKPGIPYITAFDYEYKPSRGTVKETYDHIEADLKMARDLMVDIDQDINAAGRAYIDDPAVAAILARVGLYSKQYDSAIKYSTIAISAIPLETIDEFPDIWLDATDAGVIWSAIFNSGEGRIGDPVYFVPSDRSSYRPNPTLYATYSAADIRRSTYFQVIEGRRVMSKYLAKAAQVTRPDGVVNFKALRTAEMYLIRAEAYARKGDDVSALDDLNTLRSERIAGFVPGVETGQALLDAIALERRKELLGEGHRWFDLKRTTKTINRPNCTNFCTLLPDDRAWTWPIPLTELNANPNMEQNPGY